MFTWTTYKTLLTRSSRAIKLSTSRSSPSSNPDALSLGLSMARNRKAKVTAQQPQQTTKPARSAESRKQKSESVQSQQQPHPTHTPNPTSQKDPELPEKRSSRRLPKAKRRALAALSDPSSQANRTAELPAIRAPFVGDALLQALETECLSNPDPKPLTISTIPTESRASSGRDTVTEHMTDDLDPEPRLARHSTGEPKSGPSSKERRALRRAKHIESSTASKASKINTKKIKERTTETAAEGSAKRVDPNRRKREKKARRKLKEQSKQAATSMDRSAQQEDHQGSEQPQPLRNPVQANQVSSNSQQQGYVPNSGPFPSTMQPSLPQFGSHTPVAWPLPPGMMPPNGLPSFTPINQTWSPGLPVSFQGGLPGAFFPGPDGAASFLGNANNFFPNFGNQSASHSSQAQHNKKISVLPVPTPTKQYLELSSKEPVRLETPQNILLVMDLNGTLVHRPKRETTKMIARPHCNEFLDEIFKIASVMVWSSAKAPNVQIMCGKTFSPDQEKQLLAKWSRDHLKIPQQYFNSNIQVYKHLTWIWDFKKSKIYHPDHASGKRWDATNTILLDDSILKAASEPYNLIQVSEFKGNISVEDETLLAQITDYITEVKNYDNAAACIRSCPFKFDPEWRDPNT